MPHGGRPIAAWLADGRPIRAPPCGDRQNAALPNDRGLDERHPSDRCSDALEPDDRSWGGLTTAEMPPASATTWSRDLHGSPFRADVPRGHDDAHRPTGCPTPSAIARNDRCRIAHRATHLDAFGAGFRRGNAALPRCDRRVDLPSPFLSPPLSKCKTTRAYLTPSFLHIASLALRSARSSRFARGSAGLCTPVFRALRSKARWIRTSATCGFFDSKGP